MAVKGNGRHKGLTPRRFKPEELERVLKGLPAEFVDYCEQIVIGDSYDPDPRQEAKNLGYREFATQIFLANRG
jgi:hypothetical protein